MDLRIAPTLALFALTAPLSAQQAVTIDDFEGGVGQWGANDPRVMEGKAAYASIQATDEAHEGSSAMRVSFEPGAGWAVIQRSLDGGLLAEHGCQGISFRIKPDGSGKAVKVLLARYEGESRVFEAEMRLDGVAWKQVNLPFSAFTPRGDYSFRLEEIRALQFGFEGEIPQVSFVLDAILAEPQTSADGPFWDLFIPAHGGWGFRNAEQVEVPNSGADDLRGRLAEFIHGVVNHPDMRSPVTFLVNYPQGGRFIVLVRETSGAGGGGLTLSVDGEECLRRDFPAEADGPVTEFAGEYGVDVPPGKHEVRVDSHGRDWTRVRGYRLARYVPWRVEADERAGTVTLRLNGMDGEPVPDAAASANVVGRDVAMNAAAPGVYRTAPLRESLERGLYPVRVRAEKGRKLLCEAETKLKVERRRLQLARAAYPLGESITLQVRYRDEALKPIAGAGITARVGVRELRPEPTDEPGLYEAVCGPLELGAHEVLLEAQKPPEKSAAAILVHRPFGEPVNRGLVRLRPDGLFELNDEPWLPVGFASIHVFEPTLPMPELAGGWTESAWCNAPDQTVADWMATLAASGINVVRIGLTVKWDGVEGDIGGDVSPEFVARFRRFLEVCDSMGMRVLPVLYWGHWETFGLNDVAAYVPLMGDWVDWYRNQQALGLQQAFARKIASEFASDPRIVAWEPMNEIHPAPKGDPGIPVAWTNAICEALREVDPEHLITESPNTWQPESFVYFARNSNADFVNYHWYPDFVAFTDDIGDRVAAASACNQLGPKPAIIGEVGWTGRGLGGRYPQGVRLTTRDFLWLAVLSGSRGAIGWDGATTDPRECRMLAEVLGDCGFAGLAKRRSPHAVLVSDVAAEYDNVARYEHAFSEIGIDFDVVSAEDAGAARVWSARDYTPPSHGGPGIVNVSRGYRSKVWVGRDDTVLAYVRNCGGADGYGNRTPRKVSLGLELELPTRAWVRVYDLDQQKVAVERGPADKHKIDLRSTTSDYVIWASPGGF
jgi:hypothetical protein